MFVQNCNPGNEEQLPLFILKTLRKNVPYKYHLGVAEGLNLTQLVRKDFVFAFEFTSYV
jgi:hypothetical protein